MSLNTEILWILTRIIVHIHLFVPINVLSLCCPSIFFFNYFFKMGQSGICFNGRLAREGKMDHHFVSKNTKDFRDLKRENISACIFSFYPSDPVFRQNRLHRLQSWAAVASLDTHINSLDQLWRLWQLWPNPQYGHYGDLAIVAIDAIVDPCY